ncbi:MAG: 2OG-Fe(II) oxygenase [Pseudomonadota bacterium]
MTAEARPFVIGAAATVLLDPAEAYRDGFTARRSILCRDAFEPGFLGTLRNLCNRGHFVAETVDGLGDREVEAPQRAGGAITLALQRAGLLRWLEAATGCGPLGTAEGRVVQARPNDHDQLDWHNDLYDPQRRLAVTVNLTETPYEGGLFELRTVRTRETLTAHRHAAPGDMMIFDVTRDLEHRVLPVTAGGPRRVYTGWFFKA